MRFVIIPVQGPVAAPGNDEERRVTRQSARSNQANEAADAVQVHVHLNTRADGVRGGSRGRTKRRGGRAQRERILPEEAAGGLLY